MIIANWIVQNSNSHEFQSNNMVIPHLGAQ